MDAKKYFVGTDVFTSLNNASIIARSRGVVITDESGNVVEPSFVKGTVSKAAKRRYEQRKAVAEAYARGVKSNWK